MSSTPSDILVSSSSFITEVPAIITSKTDTLSVTSSDTFTYVTPFTSTRLINTVTVSICSTISEFITSSNVLTSTNSPTPVPRKFYHNY